MLAACNGTPLTQVEAAVARGASVDEVAALIPWDELEALKFELTSELESVLLKAADVAQKGQTWADLHAPMFDLTNPESLAWIRGHAAELVDKNIVAGAKDAIRAVIERGFLEGIPPAEMARMIREYIGLLPQHIAAVDKYYQKRLAKVGEARAIVGRDAYARKLLNLRARTIARNETMVASNRGQWELWQEARAKGYLPDDQFERKWIVTPDDRLCAICAPLANDRAPINGMFAKAGVENPPKHVACRCSQGIARKEKAQEQR